MKQLLEMAQKVADKVEIYAVEGQNDSVAFQDAKLHEIESSLSKGVSLRIIKDGKLGFAYTKNLNDRQAFLQNALKSLQGGVEANFDFPFTDALPQLKTYDADIETVSSTQMLDESKRLVNFLQENTQGEISSEVGKNIAEVRVLNSNGTDIFQKYSSYYSYASIGLPGSGSGIGRVFSAKTFDLFPQKTLDEAVHFFNATQKQASVKGGKMKLLFMPSTLYTLMWRLLNGANGRSLYEKTSRLAGKEGQKMLSEKVSIYNDPLNDSIPGARAFDDEGCKTERFDLFKEGVFQQFYYNLDYAQKMAVQPTGHGFRSGQWGGDPVTMKPQPSLSHAAIAPGEKSLAELIQSIDRGVIVESVLGAHSGNIPNGDFSVGLDPCLYVENGQIVGQLKGAMAAGNAYDLLNQVVDLENELHDGFSGRFPAMLFDGVNIATN